MAPPAYPPPPSDYQLFGFGSDDYAEHLDDGFEYEEAPLTDESSGDEGSGPIAMAEFSGDLDEDPGLDTSSGSSDDSNVRLPYGSSRALYSYAAFQYSYTGKLDIAYFDAVIENTEDSLALMRNLAVVPRCSIEKEKAVSKVEATPASWEHLRETVQGNLFFLVEKLMARVLSDQLETFQLDEPNSGKIFPALQNQLDSLKHMSLHETSLVSHFAEEKIPRRLQSLVIHGISINIGGQFLTFLVHLGRYHRSLNYLALDFENLSFGPDVDWVGLEKHFSSIRCLTKLQSLTVSGCQDMMALQFSTLNLIPWPSLKRLKIINCPSVEAGGCPGLTRRLRVENLTHLCLIRTCSPQDAAELIRELSAGLQRLHLEFSYEQGQMPLECLMTNHVNTLRYLWMEASTGKHFRLVESTTSTEPFMMEFSRFKRLRELAIAIRYAAIEKYTIDWENPPNLRIFRILNLVERYVHNMKDKERCVCKIVEDFSRIHDDELATFLPRDLQIIVVGRHIEAAPEVEPIYYWANVPQSDSDSDGSSTNSNPLEGMTFGEDPIHKQFMAHQHRRRHSHQRHDKRSQEPDGIDQQSVEYDAGDEADSGDEPPSPDLQGLSEPFSALNLGHNNGRNDDDEENPALGTPALPSPDQNSCILTNIDEIKTQIREITIIDVDRQGAPFWEQDEMVIEQRYPNPVYTGI
ncbi:hypothetical protein TWF718_007870 [Orbilia javanica]|uniref:Uncharacterized protein n=1 Tax=Orbilia javanica TaxID=47235 RepID=A0AAN8N3S1_9PEZI